MVEQQHVKTIEAIIEHVMNLGVEPGNRYLHIITYISKLRQLPVLINDCQVNEV